MKKERIIKIIAWVLIAAFIAQGVVWANPEIFENRQGISTLQIPSFFKPLDARIDKQVLEVTLKSILEYAHETLEKGGFRYHLTPTIDNVLLDLEFDKAHKEGEAIIVPCGTSSDRSTRLYEAIISSDKSIKLIHRLADKIGDVSLKSNQLPGNLSPNSKNPSLRALYPSEASGTGRSNLKKEIASVAPLPRNDDIKQFGDRLSGKMLEKERNIPIDVLISTISNSDKLVSIMEYYRPFSEDWRSTTAGLFAPTHFVKFVDLLKKLNVKPGMKLLDAGCGNGIILAIANAFGLETVGYELDKELFDVCNTNLNRLSDEGVVDLSSTKVVLGDYCDADLSELDIVYMYWTPARINGILLSVEEYAAYFKRFEENLTRLKPGARFVILGGPKDLLSRLVEQKILIEDALTYIPFRVFSRTQTKAAIISGGDDPYTRTKPLPEPAARGLGKGHKGLSPALSASSAGVLAAVDNALDSEVVIVNTEGITNVLLLGLGVISVIMFFLDFWYFRKISRRVKQAFDECGRSRRLPNAIAGKQRKVESRDRHYKQMLSSEAGSPEDRFNRQLGLSGASLYSGIKLFHHGGQFSALAGQGDGEEKKKKGSDPIFGEKLNAIVARGPNSLLGLRRKMGDKVSMEDLYVAILSFGLLGHKNIFITDKHAIAKIRRIAEHLILDREGKLTPEQLHEELRKIKYFSQVRIWTVLQDIDLDQTLVGKAGLSQWLSPDKGLNLVQEFINRRRQAELDIVASMTAKGLSAISVERLTSELRKIRIFKHVSAATVYEDIKNEKTKNRKLAQSKVAERDRKEGDVPVKKERQAGYSYVNFAAVNSRYKAGLSTEMRNYTGKALVNEKGVPETFFLDSPGGLIEVSVIIERALDGEHYPVQHNILGTDGIVTMSYPLVLRRASDRALINSKWQYTQNTVAVERVKYGDDLVLENVSLGTYGRLSAVFNCERVYIGNEYSYRRANMHMTSSMPFDRIVFPAESGRPETTLEVIWERGVNIDTGKEEDFIVSHTDRTIGSEPKTAIYKRVYRKTSESENVLVYSSVKLVPEEIVRKAGDCFVHGLDILSVNGRYYYVFLTNRDYKIPNKYRAGTPVVEWDGQNHRPKLMTIEFNEGDISKVELTPWFDEIWKVAGDSASGFSFTGETNEHIVGFSVKEFNREGAPREKPDIALRKGYKTIGNDKHLVYAAGAIMMFRVAPLGEITFPDIPVYVKANVSHAIVMAGENIDLPVEFTIYKKCDVTIGKENRPDLNGKITHLRFRAVEGHTALEVDVARTGDVIESFDSGSIKRPLKLIWSNGSKSSKLVGSCLSVTRELLESLGGDLTITGIESSTRLKAGLNDLYMPYRLQNRPAVVHAQNGVVDYVIFPKTDTEPAAVLKINYEEGFPFLPVHYTVEIEGEQKDEIEFLRAYDNNNKLVVTSVEKNRLTLMLRESGFTGMVKGPLYTDECGVFNIGGKVFVDALHPNERIDVRYLNGGSLYIVSPLITEEIKLDPDLELLFQKNTGLILDTLQPYIPFARYLRLDIEDFVETAGKVALLKATEIFDKDIHHSQDALISECAMASARNYMYTNSNAKAMNLSQADFWFYARLYNIERAILVSNGDEVIDEELAAKYLYNAGIENSVGNIDKVLPKVANRNVIFQRLRISSDLRESPIPVLWVSAAKRAKPNAVSAFARADASCETARILTTVEGSLKHKIIILKLIGGCSFEEIASILGFDASRVMGLYKNALEEIERHLTAKGLNFRFPFELSQEDTQEGEDYASLRRVYGTTRVIDGEERPFGVYDIVDWSHASYETMQAFTLGGINESIECVIGNMGSEALAGLDDIRIMRRVPADGAKKNDIFVRYFANEDSKRLEINRRLSKVPRSLAKMALMHDMAHATFDIFSLGTMPEELAEVTSIISHVISTLQYEKPEGRQDIVNALRQLNSESPSEANEAFIELHEEIFNAYDMGELDRESEEGSLFIVGRVVGWVKRYLYPESALLENSIEEFFEMSNQINGYILQDTLIKINASDAVVTLTPIRLFGGEDMPQKENWHFLILNHPDYAWRIFSKLDARHRLSETEYFENFMDQAFDEISDADQEEPAGKAIIEAYAKMLGSIELSPDSKRIYIFRINQCIIDRIDSVLKIAPPGAVHPPELALNNRIIMVSMDNPHYQGPPEVVGDAIEALRQHGMAHIAQLGCKGYIEEAASALNRANKINKLRSVLNMPPEYADDVAVVREASAKLAELEYLFYHQLARVDQPFLDSLLDGLGATRLGAEVPTILGYENTIPAVNKMLFQIRRIMAEDDWLPTGVFPHMASGDARGMTEPSRDGNYTIERNGFGKITRIIAKDGAVILEADYGADPAGVIRSITVTDTLRNAPGYSLEHPAAFVIPFVDGGAVSVVKNYDSDYAVTEVRGDNSINITWFKMPGEDANAALLVDTITEKVLINPEDTMFTWRVFTSISLLKSVWSACGDIVKIAVTKGLDNCRAALLPGIGYTSSDRLKVIDKEILDKYIPKDGRPFTVADKGASDARTSLDLAVKIKERGLNGKVVASDNLVQFRLVKSFGDEALFDFEGEIYAVYHNGVIYKRGEFLDELAPEVITQLRSAYATGKEFTRIMPGVEEFMKENQGSLGFVNEDMIDPRLEKNKYDVVRVCNVLRRFNYDGRLHILKMAGATVKDGGYIIAGEEIEGDLMYAVWHRNGSNLVKVDKVGEYFNRNLYNEIILDDIVEDSGHNPAAIVFPGGSIVTIHYAEDEPSRLDIAFIDGQTTELSANCTGTLSDGREVRFKQTATGYEMTIKKGDQMKVYVFAKNGERVKKKKKPDPISKLEPAYMSEGLLALEERDEIYTAIHAAGLNPNDRAVIYYYYWEGKTLQQIGAILGVTDGRIGQRKERALKKIREAMESMHQKEEKKKGSISTFSYGLAAGNAADPAASQTSSITSQPVALSTPAIKGSKAEGQPVQFLRNIARPEDLTQNMIEGILSALFSNKKVALTFSRKLKGLESAQLVTLVKHLDDWKRNLGKNSKHMEALLDNLIVLEYDSQEELKTVLEGKGINMEDGRNNLVFTYAPRPKDESENTVNMGKAVRPVYILEQEDGFPSNYYYPLLEMVTISLAKELLGWDEKELNAALIASNIDKEFFGIEPMIEKETGILIFKVLPKMERYDTDSKTDRYTRLLQFLRSA